jgi:hypothetical protein
LAIKRKFLSQEYDKYFYRGKRLTPKQKEWNEEIRKALTRSESWVRKFHAVAEVPQKPAELGKKVTAKECFPVMGSDEAAVLDFADVRSAIITDNEADAYYTIVIKLNPEKNPNQGDSVYGKLYKITKDEDIIKAFDGFKDFFTVGSYDANYGVGTIRMQVDKKSDRVMKVELIREVAIETTVTGQGAMKDEIGKDIPATFNYSSTATYDVLWKDIPVE